MLRQNYDSTLFTGSDDNKTLEKSSKIMNCFCLLFVQTKTSKTRTNDV